MKRKDVEAITANAVVQLLPDMILFPVSFILLTPVKFPFLLSNHPSITRWIDAVRRQTKSPYLVLFSCVPLKDLGKLVFDGISRLILSIGRFPRLA